MKNLILLLFTSWACLAFSQNIDEYALLMERGEYKKAKDLATSNIQIDSLDLAAISCLARIYESEQNIARAIKYNTMKWKLDTTNYLVARKLGQLYEEAEITREALQFYNKAYQSNPEDFITIKGFVNILTLTDQLDIADSILRKGLERDSSNVAFLMAEGRLAYRMRDMVRTSEALLKAGYYTNLSNYYQRMLGYALLQQDSTDLAIRYLMGALETDKNPEITYYYLALAYERKKDDASAVGYYKKAIEEGVTKELGNYYFRIGQIQFLNKDYKSACKYLEESLSHDVNKALCHYFLAIAYDTRFTDKTKAAYHFDKSLKSSGIFDPQMKEYAQARLIKIKEITHQRQ